LRRQGGSPYADLQAGILGFCRAKAGRDTTEMSYYPPREIARRVLSPFVLVLGASAEL
jgi:hypothetical protein